MKQRVASAQIPHVLAWQALEKELAAANTPKPYVGNDGKAFYNAAHGQAARARDLALAWWMTGENKYADQAVNYLVAWSQAQPTPGQEFT